MNDSGVPEVKPGSVADGIQFQTPTQKVEKVASAAKNSPAWDEDWALPTKSSVSRGPGPANSQFNNSTVQSQQSNQTTVPTTCPPVDIEWPPRQSSNVTTQRANDGTQLNATGTSSTPTFDELDPFANWPPRPNGASIASGGFHNGTATQPPRNNSGSGLSNNLPDSSTQALTANDFWAFGTPSLSSLKSQQEGSGVSATSNAGPMNSFGIQNQNQGMPSFGSSSYSNQKHPADISSIFSSSKTEQAAMKLAPPPSVAVGRGRGRGRSGTSNSRSSGSKQQQTEQSSLLDLL